MKAQLVIKGTSKDAYREADRLGIKLSNVSALRMDETIADAYADADTLNRWYTREVEVSEGGEFPAGSLLFWGWSAA